MKLFNHYGFGDLLHLERDVEIAYRPLDVARRSLRILANAGLCDGDHLELVGDGRRVSLWVAEGGENTPQAGISSYTLVACEDDADLEIHAVAAGTGAGPWKIRRTRFACGASLVVEARVIGASEMHTLQVRDISRTGVLAVPAGDKVVPFLFNTSIEVTIDPSGGLYRRSDSVHRPCGAAVHGAGSRGEKVGNLARTQFPRNG